MSHAVAEEPLVFECQGDRLVGVLSGPVAKEQARSIGVVIVVGGPQYRAGSHTQYVQLARALARSGIVSVRFDCRGMGDSEGEFPGFESIDPDVRSAIDVLMALRPALSGVVLWGLCDAASAALMYCHRQADGRIAGLCLANPWVRSEATLARARIRHYYLARVFEASFWRRMLSGQLHPIRAARALRDNWIAARHAKDEPLGAFQSQMAAAWRNFPGPMLLLLSERDATAQEFLECLRSDAAWSGALRRSGITEHLLPGADHTFTDATSRMDAEQATSRFVLSLCSDAQPAHAVQ